MKTTLRQRLQRLEFEWLEEAAGWNECAEMALKEGDLELFKRNHARHTTLFQCLTDVQRIMRRQKPDKERTQ